MELHYVSIRYEGDYDAVARRLRITEDYADEFREIYDECLRIARPKGVFTRCAVSREGPCTILGDQRFNSRVLAVNFSEAANAYPYVITCGRELYDLACETEDPLWRYWIDSIAEATLGPMGARLRQAMREAYGLGRLSSVNPGSLSDFPLPCQRPLFNLLGEGPERIGLELTPTFLMLPYKSGSGIYFESEERYENCALCPRLDCPGRRMPFSEALLHAYGLQEDAPDDACHAAQA